jgi:hypothetical protein
LTSTQRIGEKNKEQKESQCETHRQEATHNHDPPLHSRWKKKRQEETTQKLNQARHFIKAKYLQRASSLTDFWEK